MKQEEFKLNNEFSEDLLVKELQTLYFILNQNYNYNLKKIIGKLGDELLIPCSIFNKKLSTFETITKYLKENQNKSFKEISNLTERSYRAVWGAYQSSLEKHPQILTKEKSQFYFPVSILKNKSMLQSVSIFLKESYKLTYKEIADIIKRDQRTIWTVINR